MIYDYTRKEYVFYVKILSCRKYLFSFELIQSRPNCIPDTCGLFCQLHFSQVACFIIYLIAMTIGFLSFR